MCSPLTLFAVLAVVRQAVDSFRTERTANEILDVLGSFRDQWERFVDRMDALGKQLDTVRTTYDALTSTRRRQLERQLDRIDDLRRDRGLLPADGSETSGTLIALDG
jgi:DNA recombination protein RmuC